MKSGLASKLSWIRISYWALWFNAIWAALGAWYLLAGAEGMSLNYLSETPFSNYDGPGFILLFIVGGSSLLAALARWRHIDAAFLLTVAAGAILMGWILTEFVWIPEAWVPQLLFAIVAGLMIVGGYLGWQESHARV